MKALPFSPLTDEELRVRSADAAKGIAFYVMACAAHDSGITEYDVELLTRRGLEAEALTAAFHGRFGL